MGVYGGVLVPGLLLLGVHPLFAAPLSLFLQVLIVPFGASAHVRLGNVSRPLVIPLITGGIIGAILGPVVASFFSADVIRLAVELLIIVSAILLLVSLPLKQMQVSRRCGRRAQRCASVSSARRPAWPAASPAPDGAPWA